MRTRATLVAVLSTLLLLGLAPTVSAMPAQPLPSASVTAAAPADLWISKQAMKVAWRQQSYSDRVTLCDYFDVSPSSMVRRLVNSQTGLTSWERRALRSWMFTFLNRRCAYV